MQMRQKQNARNAMAHRFGAALQAHAAVAPGLQHVEDQPAVMVALDGKHGAEGTGKLVPPDGGGEAALQHMQRQAWHTVISCWVWLFYEVNWMHALCLVTWCHLLSPAACEACGRRCQESAVPPAGARHAYAAASRPHQCPLSRLTLQLSHHSEGHYSGGRHVHIYKAAMVASKCGAAPVPCGRTTRWPSLLTSKYGVPHPGML